MSTSQWLEVLLVGALAGAVGQLVRAIAGLAGAHRNQAGQAPEALDLSRLLVSTLVGATAGALAALTMQDKFSATTPSEVILGLVAAGYAGADFIEGVAGKFGRPAGSAPPPPPAPAPSPSPPAPIAPPAPPVAHADSVG